MKKYLYLILFFLVCVPAIAGTINSYTLKSPPDDADTIVIYDSDDGSTKKIEVGDISGSGGVDSGWTDGGTNVYLTATTDNVSIGTTTPNATSLEIVKQSTTIPLKISSTATGNGDYFVVSSDGNVGIGTSLAASKLRIFSSASTLMTAFSTAPSSSGTTGVLNIGTNDGAAISVGDQFASLKFLGSIDSAGTTSATADITAVATEDLGASNKGTRLDFRSSKIGSSGPTVILTLSGDNVGIGTTKPSSNLEVVKISNNKPLMVSSSVGRNGDFMTVTSSGLVGKGTTNPLSTLHVDGTIIPMRTTSDPCSAPKAGALFYNSTSNYWCGCNGTDDVKLTDNTTACF